MADKIKPRLKGYIKITNIEDGKILYEGNNTINVNAIKVMAQCLSPVGGIKAVDTIKAPSVSSSTEITSTSYNEGTNTITFTGIFGPSSFDGSISLLELWSNSIGLQFATKAGLDINKDSNSSLQIDWSITVTQN